MAKDPAFLFYPNDWIGGTMGMTFEEKGAYVELLMLQFNRGHMTEHMIAQTIGQIWVKIEVKFRMDEQGLWYNPRLDEEKQKRQEFTKSRRNNVLGTNQHSKSRGHKKGHMTSHMEDVNEDVIRVGVLGGKEDDKGGMGGEAGEKEEREEGAPLTQALVPQMHTIWTTTIPGYTANRELDYPALKTMAIFIFKTAGVKNGFGNADLEIKVLNTFQLIADQVNREQFWITKSLSSIANHIQEFYNKIKNPTNGSTASKPRNGTGIDQDRLKQKTADYLNSRRQQNGG